MPTSDDVMQLASECAARVNLPRRRRRYPNFAEVEEQCPEEYEELLALLHEDIGLRLAQLAPPTPAEDEDDEGFLDQ